MKEWIGNCRNCREKIYCENGFFNGVVLPGHEYLCFECENQESNHQDKPNNAE